MSETLDVMPFDSDGKLYFQASELLQVMDRFRITTSDLATLAQTHGFQIRYLGDVSYVLEKVEVQGE